MRQGSEIPSKRKSWSASLENERVTFLTLLCFGLSKVEKQQKSTAPQ